MSNNISGIVAKIIDENTLVINKGSLDGINERQEFFIYYKDEEIFDPETQESLGTLEVSCGIGKVEHIQDNMTTIVPARTKKEEVPIPEAAGLFSTPKKIRSIPIPFKTAKKEGLLFKVLQ